MDSTRATNVESRPAANGSTVITFAPDTLSRSFPLPKKFNLDSLFQSDAFRETVQRAVEEGARGPDSQRA
jgi:hypothetical protein